MSVLNPNIRHISIDGALFQDEVEEREVMSVPAVFLNGASFHYGRTNIEGLLDKMGVEESEDQIQALKDRKSTRLNSSHVAISYAVFCLKKKNGQRDDLHTATSFADAGRKRSASATTSPTTTSAGDARPREPRASSASCAVTTSRPTVIS